MQPSPCPESDVFEPFDFLSLKECQGLRRKVRAVLIPWSCSKPLTEIANVPRAESGFSKPPRTMEYRANCVVFSQRGKPVLGSGLRSSGDKTSAISVPLPKLLFR